MIGDYCVIFDWIISQFKIDGARISYGFCEFLLEIIQKFNLGFVMGFEYFFCLLNTESMELLWELIWESWMQEFRTFDWIYLEIYNGVFERLKCEVSVKA